MRIRAAVLEEFGQPLVVQDIELADPRASEVLVRLVACGVCHIAVMRQAVESARMGWGLCTVAGVAGKGETLDV